METSEPAVISNGVTENGERRVWQCSRVLSACVCVCVSVILWILNAGSDGRKKGKHPNPVKG